MRYTTELQNSITYLSSPAACDALLWDVYWPKWNSPWWHMLLLHEMGETSKIPRIIIDKFVDGFKKYSLKIFPINESDLPKEICSYRGYPCHCQLGNVYQVLYAIGVNVDQELPWVRPWFLRYQMADGGMNCDNSAYLVKNEVASSMVGTIAAFEAILFCTKRPLTDEERRFVDKAAGFFIERKLINGSSSNHNAAERESAKNWLKPCFPRFYLYDALRGLYALAMWSIETQQKIPEEAIENVVDHFSRRFNNDAIRNERRSFEKIGSRIRTINGKWQFQQAAERFPLLESVSTIGDISPYLSQQWQKTKSALIAANAFPKRHEKFT